MDGLSLTAVVRELNCIIGGRIEKVQQPERDELLIAIHAAGGSYRLLASASPENCRLVLTDERKASPAEAPAFLMLMRKYLTGARISSVDQPNGDRVVLLGIETYSDMRDELRLTLVIEIMGRHSNVILLDGDGVIIDAIRRVSPSVSSMRLVLPKLKYEYPPSKQKQDARHASAADFLSVLEDAVKPEAALSDRFYGLSPAVAKRLIASLDNGSGPRHIAEALERYYSDLLRGEYSPCVLRADGKTVCHLPFIPKDGEAVPYATMSEAVNSFYETRAAEESIRRRTSSYEHVIRNAAAKLERKLGIFSEAISSEEENERLRLYGELITANLYSIPPRASSFACVNYYSEDGEIVEIPLDPKLSAADNAQKYYNSYRKAKLTREHALGMFNEASAELAYLEELLYTLTCCEGESELSELRQELISGGYMRDEAAKRLKNGRSAGTQKLPASKPYHFVSRDGIDIFVGKNNRQNDKLTASAGAMDTWLHTKDIHGSHVIIKKAEPVPDDTLYDAAMLAAYYSKARGSANVPVDFTLVKYVKKPSGAKPGMVTYTHQRTVFVTPEREYATMLLQNKR